MLHNLGQNDNSINRERIIPNEKIIGIWARMKMERSREVFGYDRPLWKQRRVHILQFPDHIATKELKQKSQKNNRKRKGQKSGCDKPSPLKKSHPRDLVAQGTSMNILT